jgi:hypothetical protein
MATQIGQELCPPEEYEHPCECLSEVSYYPLPKVIVDMACDLIPFPQPPAGKYKIFLKYRLPGKEGVHSSMAAEVERQEP